MLATLTADVFMCAVTFPNPASSYEHWFEKIETWCTIRSALREKKGHKRCATKEKQNYRATVIWVKKKKKSVIPETNTEF